MAETITNRDFKTPEVRPEDKVATQETIYSAPDKFVVVSITVGGDQIVVTYTKERSGVWTKNVGSEW